MRRSSLFSIIILGITLTACATAPPVENSRQMLWQKFGNQPLDNLLLAWGPPTAETKLTNGARMVTYSYTYISDFGYYDQYMYRCKASFLAPPPAYKIDNVSLDGDPNECSELAQGRTGIATNIPLRPSFYMGFHHSYH